MEDNINNIQHSVMSFVEKTVETIRNYKDSMQERIKAILEGLSVITQEFSTETYSFNLAIEIFVETAYKNLSECLESILANADFEDKDARVSNVNFAAYYALSLIYKKEGDYENLRHLLGEKYKPLSRHPLYYEVHSRCYKRLDSYEQALSCDKRAINILGRKNIKNIALCISYASTVCSMLRKNIQTLTTEDIELAGKYIDEAIEFNPDYSKYYFLKAQFVFLSVYRNSPDIDTLETAKKEAYRLIDEIADVVLYECYQDGNVFNESERSNYSFFKQYMDDAINRKKSPRFVKSETELSKLKKKILSAENQDVCTSNFCLPPIPSLHKNDKYFFVCYSSTDFKSVYCDLIELYKNKIPFKYDERLKHGIGWQEQVEKEISNENCVGVVFYLSKNILGSEAVYDEISIAQKYAKEYFCVNLEGSNLPSRMLIDFIIETHKDNQSTYPITGERMKLFLNFFGDNFVFTHKFTQNGVDGIKHFEAYIDALADKFPQLIIGD